MTTLLHPPRLDPTRGQHIAVPVNSRPATSRSATSRRRAAARRLPHPSARGVVQGVALAFVLLALAIAGWWRMEGGTWQRVLTPSMGQVAPVGTLLWVAPADFDALAVGDFITFQPPGSQTTYSHLVKGVNADGTLRTGGVISGDDPWQLGPNDVLGKVHRTWPGVGWLVQGLPVFLAGLLLLTIARTYARPDLRLPITVLIISGTLAAFVAIYQPLTRTEQLAFSGDGPKATATYVNTGVLPLRLSTLAGEESALLSPGEVGTVVSTKANDKGQYGVRVEPEIPAGFYGALVTLCLAPAIWATIIGVPSKSAPRRRRS